MVRGPAALLSAATAGAALLLLAPVLPSLGGGDAEALVAGGAALAGIAACGLVAARATEVPAVLWLAVPAAALLLAALNAADLAGAATPAEALAYALAGVTLATLLDTPALVLALPVFAAVVDVVSVLGGASGALVLGPRVAPGDPLSLELPTWGAVHAVGRLNPAAVVFLGWYAAYARRFSLHDAATALGLTAAVLGALVWAVASGGAVPVLALLGAGLLAPNAARLGAVARAARDDRRLPDGPAAR